MCGPFFSCVALLCLISVLCESCVYLMMTDNRWFFAGHPDGIVAVIPLHRTLYLRGKRFTHAALNAHTIEYMFKAGMAGMYLQILVSVVVGRIW